MNEENPVRADPAAAPGHLRREDRTNWKEVGGADAEIVAFQRREDSGSQTLFQKLLIQGGS